MTVNSYGSMGTAWSQAGELGLLIEHHFIDNEMVQTHSKSRLLCQIGTICLIVIGQIPISRISISQAPHRAISWIQSISNGIGFSLVNIWANERMMTKHSSTPILVKIAAVVGGLISQIPLFYMAYFYNDNSILCGALVLIANSPGPIYSLMLMMDPNEQERDAKQHFIEQLSKNEQKWIEHVRHSNSIHALSVLFESIPEQKKSCLRKTGFHIAQGAGALLSSANTLLAGTLGFKCAEQWTNSGLACYAVGFGAAFCTTKLFFEGMMKTTTRTYDYVIERWNGTQMPPLASQLKPRLTMALWLLGLILSCFAFDPSLVACQDNYSSPLREGMKGLVPVGLYLIIANAITDLVNEIVLIGIGHCGTEEKQLIVQLHNQLEHFKKIIAESSDEAFIQLRNGLPNILLPLSQIVLSH